MTGILFLASEFIERMSNPAYGVLVNEDYAIRLARVLMSGEIESMLTREAEELTDIDALTPHGWIWLVGWARARGIVLNDMLLLGLAEKWSTVSMQASVIDLATRWKKWQREPGGEPTPLERFEDPWLFTLLQHCTKHEHEPGVEPGPVHTGRAEKLLMALLQVGNDITLEAASTLLNHSWAGSSKLVQFFWLWCDGLDEETREIWVSRIRPPEDPRKRDLPG